MCETVDALVAELRPGARERARPSSRLDRDLGLDSLARAELMLRLEQRFAVQLAEGTLGAAEMVADLVRAVEAARPAEGEGTPALAARSVAEPLDEHPHEARTLIEVLDWHVAHHGERVHVLLQDEQEREQPIRYVDLQRGAAAIAAGLAARGLGAGQSVAIMLPTSFDYLRSFLGILMAGGVPVPIYPPARLSQIEDHVRRHARILANAEAQFLITVREATTVARLLRAHAQTIREVLTADELSDSDSGTPLPTAKPTDVAFVQYTSGSTGDPKGVMLTHANLLANIRAIAERAKIGGGDVYVSWLPLYHDMGLICAWLLSLYYALPFVLMSPLAFLARPQRWLRAIHRHRATLSGAPNFAYELCSRKIPDAALEGLDLSSWRVAYNGAEPVNIATLEGFAQRYAGYGFKREALIPAYGLAECSVGLACPPPGRGYVIDRVRREAFTERGEARPAAEGDGNALSIVGCGYPLPGHEIRIVDGSGAELGEREQGRLQFRGPSATQGYLRRPEETRKLIRDGWLDSGDLGYIAGGEVFITGRAKDLIIRGGRNFHPQELEAAIGALEGVRQGCVAVFGSPHPQTGAERLIVLAETRIEDEAQREDLRRRIAERADELLGAPPDDIVLAPPQTVLKTSSGKIRRAASRAFYEQGGRSVHRAPAWWQLLRLGWGAALPELRRSVQSLASRAYALYVVAACALLAPLLFAAIVLPPRQATRWRNARRVARTLLRVCAVPVQVNGREHLDEAARGVVVANHCSYTDGIVLTAVWPQPLRFIAKSEFRDQFWAGMLLRRLGVEFVERFDPERGVSDAQRLVQDAARGDRLMFFPEGTFTRSPGLRPFRLGAFAAAAGAGVPVIPVALRGTRSLLREGSWRLRRVPVTVDIGAPLTARDGSWESALRLRDAARDSILRRCGEPDLA